LEEDLGAVCRIEKDSFPDPWSQRDFRSLLDFSQAIFLVAADQRTGEVSGYTIALAVADQAEVLNIAV